MPDPVSERARTFAEIKDLWHAVHEATNRANLPALDRVYLEGMEEVLDWLMADTCPSGDTRPRGAPPLTSGYGWTLMLVPGMAAKDAHDDNGAIYITKPTEELEDP